MIYIRNLKLNFGKKVIFDEVSVSFTSGNCYGIIGANGSGKSTLLKIINNEMNYQKGSIEIQPGNRIAVLRQNQDEFDDIAIIKVVLMGYKKLWTVYQQREKIYSKDEFTEEDGLKAAELEAEFGELGGYEAESNAAQLLNDLGIKDELQQQILKSVPNNLKVRVLLAQALFGNPEILLLDEPTNGLDIDTIKWLENFLINYNNLALVVSHDRHFLDAICTHVADIDRQKINTYTGNYTFWYESSQLMSRQIADKNKKVEDKRQALIDFIARFSANASKSKQATSRKKALEKLNIEEIKPSNRKYPGIIFKPQRELGNQILKVDNISFQHNNSTLFNNISFSVNKNDKIGLISKNPLFISHFFNIITKKELHFRGEVEWGTTTIFDYLPVNIEEYFLVQKSLIDWLREFVPDYIKDVDEPFLRGFLGKMLFSGDDIFKQTNVLSGGEKVRCMLSKIMLQNPNVVILDQPTNHLDLESIQSFNEACQQFPGVILLTSHDWTFMQTVCNRIIEITPTGCIDRLCTFDEYMEMTSKTM